MAVLKSTFMFLFFALFLLGCINNDTPGPTGPQGPRGPAGPAGDETIGLMYEIEFDLVSSNKWEALYDFPTADVIYKEDVVLVYLLWSQITNTDGTKTDVWRLMPVNYFNTAGIFSINYDFSVRDVRIFGDASYTKEAVKDDYRDLVARIVVVPADFSPNGRKEVVNFNDYEQVKKAFKLPDTPVSKGTPFTKIAEANKNTKAL